MLKNTNFGFSLVEILVVIVIVSILSAIALPAYNEYIARGRIVEAHSALSASKMTIEQFFQDNRTYVGAQCPTNNSRIGFNYSCNFAATTFTVTATGTGPSVGFVFTINQSNVQATTSAPTGWATSSTCWVTRKGGC